MSGYTVVTLHGVSVGNDEDVRGYSAPFILGLKAAFGRKKRGGPDLRFVEVAWASLAKAYSSSALGHFKVFESIEAVDYAADVVAYSDDGCKDKILDHVRQVYEGCPDPVILVGHSMASVIWMDLLIGLLESGSGVPGRGLPVALVTLGSPLGTDLPLLPHYGYTDRADKLEAVLPHGLKIPWLNLYDTDDVIASGGLFDTPTPLASFASYRELGVWDASVEIGYGLCAHTTYWDAPAIADRVAQFILETVDVWTHDAPPSRAS